MVKTTTIPTLRVYNRYNAPPGRPSDCGGVSMTDQDAMPSCDINLIMARSLRTGTVPTRTDMGRYGDFASALDFRESQELLVKAREQFAALSSKVRRSFDNDPAKFLHFVHSPACTPELAKDMGILSDEAVGRFSVPPPVDKPPA